MAKRSRRERRASFTAQEASSASTTPQALEKGLFLALVTLVALPPFFRGLYFPADQLFAVAATALLVALLAIRFTRADAQRPRLRPLDWAVAALPVAYVLSLLQAVHPREAIQNALLYAMYACVYWLTSRLVSRSPSGGGELRAATVLLHAILAAALGVAAIGIAAATGIADYSGAFAEGRIYSTFQYPNTTAAFLSVGFLLAVCLWGLREEEREGRSSSRALSFSYAFAASFLLAVTVYTKSRGALLVLFVCIGVNWLLSGRGRRTAFLARVVAATFAAAAALPLFGFAIRAKSASLVIAGLVASAATAAIALAVLRRLERLQRRTRVVLAASFALLCAAGAIATWAFGLVSLNLERMRTINMNDYSAWARVQWTIEGWNAFRDHWLSGIGGGGWQDVQFQYQRHMYYTKHVHNHFVQVAVDAGLPGLLAFVAMWIAAAATWISLRRWSGERRWIAAAASSGALVLGAHSWIDFNLTLSAISIALWSLLGIVGAAERIALRENPDGQKASRVPIAAFRAAAGVALLLGAYALRLFAGWQAHETAQRLLRAGNPTDALLEQQRARRLDPRNPLMAVRMAAIENAAGDADAAEAQWREATRLEPRSPFLHAALGDLLLARGKEAEAIRSFETAEELQPQWPLRYQRLSRVQLDIGAREFQAGRTAAAKPHLDAVLEQQRLLQQRLREQPDWIRTRRARRGGDTDPIVDFDAGRAKLLLGQPAAAMHDLESALRAPATQPDVWAWLAVAYARSGDPERAADAHRRAVAAKPELEPMIRAIDLFAGRAGSSTPVQR